MGVRLPSEYQEVEYLESTGTQYINTGVIPYADLPFAVKYSVTSNGSPGYGNVFGSRSTTNNNEYQVTSYQGGNASIGTRMRVDAPVNVINTVSYDGDITVTVNGQDVTFTGDKTKMTSSTYEIVLFGINQNDVVTQLQAGRIYYCKFGNVRNFVPCYRKSDDKPGMYDLVSGTFFTNQGTGEFLVGADVIDSISPWLVAWRRMLMRRKPARLPAEYQEVDYIQSDGQSCIQTDVYPSNTVGFDCKYYTENPFMYETYDYGCIFGGRYATGNNDFQITTFTRNSELHGNFRFGASTAYNAGITRFAVETARLRNLKYYAPNDTVIDIPAYNWTSNAKAIALFLLNNNGSYTQGGSGCRIYVMRFYDGGNLMRDYVPCYRKSDGVIGMYELVTNTFLTNAGLGSFTKGSNIN